MKFKDGIKEKNVIVKCGSDAILPFALVFGLFIILFGSVSSGGGFQGGVITASACILLYLGYGYNETSRALSLEVLRVNESVGAVLYVALGVVGIAFTANFCTNVFYNVGKAGDLISAGTITFMSYSVGYKVMTGVGFLLLLMLGLLAPDSDEEVE
ncbi:MAG: MnhB domain-containing protein [Lachnospiraceae bacterium]|jgi:multisubunit Na+/H+ antiporter MnhB subunit